MKKLLAALALLLSACPAPAAVQVLKATAPSTPVVACGGTDTAASGTFGAAVASAAYSIGEANQIIVDVYSAAGSTANVQIQTAPTASGPWFTAAVVANPSATGESWSIPRTGFVRINVSAWTAGAVKACLSAWMNTNKVY